MSEPLPVVSVVVPAYRQAAFMDGCLDCVKAQTYAGELEVIVVDDGCPEKSGAVAAAHPSAPKVITQPNAGVCAARNRGIGEARGEYIAFLDADDRWHPRKIERQMERVLALGKPALSFTRYRRVDEHGRPLEAVQHPAAGLQPSLSQLLRQNFVGCSTALVHRACLEATGGFPDSRDLRLGGEDYALWLRIARRFPLIYVGEVLMDYCVHKKSRMGVDAVKTFEGTAYALASYREWAGAGAFREAGVSHQGLLARQAAGLFRALVRQSADRAAWGQALGAVKSALAGSL
jgi:glycosyltransferase involved in cell wall biosynthesis